VYPVPAVLQQPSSNAHSLKTAASSVMNVGSENFLARVPKPGSKLGRYLNSKSQPGDTGHYLKMLAGEDQLDLETSRTWIPLFDVIAALILLYDVITVPWRAAFSPSSGEQLVYLQGTWLVLDVLCYVQLVIDCFVRLLKGRLECSSEFNLRNVSKAYLHGWFALHLAVALPIEHVVRLLCIAVFDLTPSHKLARLFLLVRLIRLVRAPRLRMMHWYATPLLPCLLGRATSTLNPFYLCGRPIAPIRFRWLSLAGLLLRVLAVMHITACCWFLSAVLCDFTPETWVAVRFSSMPAALRL
jgi:hypothetical protein